MICVTAAESGCPLEEGEECKEEIHNEKDDVIWLGRKDHGTNPLHSDNQPRYLNDREEKSPS